MPQDYNDLRAMLLLVSRDLRPIVTRMKEAIRRDGGVRARDFEASGEQLLTMAKIYWAQLSEIRHSVLSLSLRDAGLSLRHRSWELKRRELDADDVIFYSEVCDALDAISGTLDSGEYLCELEKLSRAMRPACYVS